MAPGQLGSVYRQELAAVQVVWTDSPALTSPHLELTGSRALIARNIFIAYIHIFLPLPLMPFIQKRLGGVLNLSFRRRFHLNSRVPQRKQLASYSNTSAQQQHAQAAPRIFNPSTQRREFSITQQQRKMASDEDYMAFLNKANQDAEEGQAAAASSAQSAGQQRTFKTQDEGSKLPKSIANALKDAFYVSEADEPFQGVSLKWKGEGGLPDEGECWLTFPFFDGLCPL